MEAQRGRSLFLYKIKGVLEHSIWCSAVASTLHQVGIHHICVRASHHPPDYDDFGSQGSTDCEDGHETETEDHKVDAEEDFPSVEQLSRQPEMEKQGDSWITKRVEST